MSKKNTNASKSPKVAKVRKTTTKQASAKVDPNAVAAPQAAKRDKKLSLLDAASQVLKAKGEPMTTGAMVETVIGKKLWTTTAPTPAATLYSAILRELKTKGGKARFKKTDRGLFAHA